MEKIELICKEKQKVFEFLMSEKKTLNFSILQTALRKKDIKVNGKKINTNCFVSEGDEISIFLPDKKKKVVPILFEDENVIIANKPLGVEATEKDKVFDESDTLEKLTGGVAVHRIDKNTTGIVVLAKNINSQDILENAFREHNIKKFYKTIVSGNVKKQGETFENYLEKCDKYVKIYEKEQNNTKYAKLRYSVLNQKGNLSLLEVELFTGRTHQIRAQLAYHKIFVLGDEKYGDKETNKLYKIYKQQLCAYKITFGNFDGNLKYLSQKTFEINEPFSLEDFVK